MRVLIATLVLLAIFAASVSATEYVVTSAQTSAQINAVVAALKPGDILTFSAGTYTNVALNLNSLKGTKNAWIVIRGAAGALPVLTINTNVVFQANIDIGSGTSFVAIANLQLSQTGTRVYAGVKLHTGNNNILLEGLTIVNINGNGIDALNINSLTNIVIRDNIIASVGLKLVDKTLVGAGIVVGGLTGYVKNVLNFRIVNNLIHDIYGFEGAAVKVLLGVKGLQILDNVIYNAGLGISTGIKSAVYVATGLIDTVLELLPLVSRNIITGSGSLTTTTNVNTRLSVALGVSVGVYAGVGTQVVNNVIAKLPIGIQVGLGLNVDLNLNLGSLLESLLGGLGLKRSSDTLATVTNVVHNTVVAVSQVALKIVDEVSDVLKGILGDVLGADLQILNNVFSILNGVEGILGVVFQLVDELLESVLGALGGATFLNNVVEGVLGGVLGGLQLDNLLSGLLGNLGLKRAEHEQQQLEANIESLRARGLLDGLLATVNGLVQNLLSGNGILGFLVDTVDNLFSGNGLLNNLSDLLPLHALLNTVVSGTNQVINQVGELVSDVLDDVQALLNDLFGDLESILTALGQLDLNAVLNAVTSKLLRNLLGNVDTLVQTVLDDLEPTLDSVLDLVDSLLITLTKGIDLNGVTRLLQRFSIGALQALGDSTKRQALSIPLEFPAPQRMAAVRSAPLLKMSS
eukprot:TRINITY_DN33_c0_g1_i4.p1 TRINITY_DN33_c0_g1~~TRINITY_DN33_c0_g1_i4.p1  ORF type:complete len:689 (-),score=162.51 TRINITY_DN33_c0_g1_i4:186-2252(-)